MGGGAPCASCAAPVAPPPRVLPRRRARAPAFIYLPPAVPYRAPADAFPARAKSKPRLCASSKRQRGPRARASRFHDIFWTYNKTTGDHRRGRNASAAKSRIRRAKSAESACGRRRVGRRPPARAPFFCVGFGGDFSKIIPGPFFSRAGGSGGGGPGRPSRGCGPVHPTLARSPGSPPTPQAQQAAAPTKGASHAIDRAPMSRVNNRVMHRRRSDTSPPPLLRGSAPPERRARRSPASRTRPRPGRWRPARWRPPAR